jgi:receptor protein-tyrosine kinase
VNATGTNGQAGMNSQALVLDGAPAEPVAQTSGAQSFVTEYPHDPYPASTTPVALELRPQSDSTPKPASPSPFPLSGLAPSALVPPPASALPVSGMPFQANSTTLSPPDSTARPTEREPSLPAPPIITQAGSQPDPERPDLVQGPPTIDAVALERGGMVDWSRTRSRISEEFRLVQRQILRAAFGPGAEPGFSNLLMVTSARPGEGKSFTSVNLAGSIARQGDHHVLLVDADSKRDSFCYALGLAEMRGLLDLVANPKLDPSPLIVKTPIDRLSILPVGRERERSAELFSTKEMTRLIQSLGRRYADRLLVLDAPPCLSTSDPAVLAPVVGQILFVVEADRTQRDEVEASLDLIQACPNITLVLNKQQVSSRYTFGAYSSYYSS